MLALLATAVTSANALDGAAACPGSKVFIEMGQGFTILGNNRVKGISSAANPSNLGSLSIASEEDGLLGAEGSMAWPMVNAEAVDAGDPVEAQGYLVNPAAIQNSGTSGLGYNVYGTIGYDAKIGCTLLGVFAGGGYLGSGTNLSIPASTAVFDLSDDQALGDDSGANGSFPATAVMPANYTLRMRSAGYVTAGLRLGYIFNKNVVGVHAAWVGLSMKAGLTGPGMTKNTVPGNVNSATPAGPVAVKTVSRFTNGVNLGIFFERMVSQNLTLGLALNMFLLGKKTYNFGSQNINWAPSTPDTSLAFNNRFRAFSVAVTAKYTLPMSR
jgi:hypothetical protein